MQHSTLLSLAISMILRPDIKLSGRQMAILQAHVKNCAECARLRRPIDMSQKVGVDAAFKSKRAGTVVNMAKYLRQKSPGGLKK